MTKFRDKTVLITGGASGIGKIMTRLCLERGARVIIWDVNEEGVQQTLSEFSPLGGITGSRVDVTHTDEVEKVGSDIIKNQGGIDILINNAGIIVGKYFHEHSRQEIEKSMEVNAMAPMHITSVFMRDMLQKDSGHICNIASSGGMIGNPKMSVYAASKWSVIGWSESVRLEMKQLKKKIKVTTVLPYYIHTGMFAGVRSRIPILKPEVAAKKIIRSIEKNKKLINIPGYLYPLTRISQGVLPIAWFDFMADKVLGIYSTMENFTGRINK